MIITTGTRSLDVGRNEARSLKPIAIAIVLINILSYSYSGAITARGTNPFHDAEPRKANSLEFQRPSNRGAKLAEGRWYMFTSPDRDFTLTFPSKPTIEDGGQGSVTLIRAFGLVTTNGVRFSINFHDIGGDPLAPENNEWGQNMELLVSEADRKDGLRVVQTHRVGKNIVETELRQTVAENGANINYLRRSILRRARVYTLACGSVIDGRKLDKSICARFFNSFRFLK